MATVTADDPAPAIAGSMAILSTGQKSFCVLRHRKCGYGRFFGFWHRLNLWNPTSIFLLYWLYSFFAPLPDGMVVSLMGRCHSVLCSTKSDVEKSWSTSQTTSEQGGVIVYRSSPLEWSPSISRALTSSCKQRQWTLLIVKHLLLRAVSASRTSQIFFVSTMDWTW